MIRVDITQCWDREHGYYCEVTAHHGRDGEYEPFSESYDVEGEWPAAIESARERYGDEISSLTVGYEHD